jgi:serine phosphatase RsbU (regulator of sigma subunit)
MDYHEHLHTLIDQYGYNGNIVAYTECYHALYTSNYSRLLKLAQKIINKGDRLKFKIAALDGLNMNQEAIDSFRVYNAWIDKQFNAETRKMTEMSSLELEAARAENEAKTLRLTNHRMMLIAIVCGLILFTVFLTVYLYRRQRQMRQLRQAYDKLEEAYEKLEDVTTQKERIESELRIARNIQLSMVPNVFPELPEIEIFASMTPAKAVGGDLYDFFVRDNQLFFCIGDVSGKGVPAALFMMMTKSLFRAYSSEESMPDRIVTLMNKTICENNKNHMFVTLFVGVFDMESGLLRYCNAGHENPIIINKEASLLPVNRIFPVGFFADTTYNMQEAVIDPQTTILLYTDGLSEAMDADEKMFGNERILEDVNQAIQTGKLSPKALIDQLTQSVHLFVGDTEQSDDLTMLAINNHKK